MVNQPLAFHWLKILDKKQGGCLRYHLKLVLIRIPASGGDACPQARAWPRGD
jgi:hypothetical protein